jgi:ATP-binding cassette subfamily C (CFTR/MRP) protein 1
VRQACFIAVPQDPFLLTDASLRFNVDPTEHYQDEEIVAALEKTQLWTQFYQPRENGQQLSSTADQVSTASDISQILDSPLKSLPQLSTGQQQLLSLARAVLRAQSPTRPVPYTDNVPTKTKPILLLDEATSSLDEETEAIIYEIIKQEFTDKGHTVIAISHRLGALKKGWKEGRDVLVRMVDGKVEEMGDLSAVIGLGDDGEAVSKESEHGGEGENGSVEELE